MMIAKVRGTFESFGGTIDLNEDNPEQTAVDIQIEAASINTREDQRDGHLKSPDFLNAEAFPYLTFKSKRVERVGEEQAHLIGDLTIRDVTKEVALDVDYEGQAKSPWGMNAVGFSANTKISRKDWGLEWNQVLETGGVLVGDEVQIDIELELVKQATQEE
jgi:polyisoprenoid-binding protein YceI